MSGSLNRLGAVAAALLVAAPLAGLRADDARNDGGGEEPPAAAPTLPFPDSGPLRVEATGRAAPGSWVRPDPAGEGAILCEGLRGVTLELDGVRLLGGPAGGDPDQREGLGLVLRGCEDLTVRGGRFEGYRISVLAEDCRGLILEGIECAGSYAPRLCSTVTAESRTDRLDGLAGEDAEERRAAALVLRDCTDVRVRGCRARGALSGLLLDGCGGCRIEGNDLSFLSGFGVALFGSQGNAIERNRLDYCVRGFHPDRPSSGLGAAAVALFEGSSDNSIAGNRATHSSNGLLLGGGAAAGGCDRNLILGNDFSFAVAEGIDLCGAAGSRILENTARGCGRSGFAASRASDTLVAHNSFGGADRAVRIGETRGVTVLAGNVLHGNEVGLDLSAPAEGEPEAAEAGGCWVVGNSFAENDSDLLVRACGGLRMAENIYEAGERELFVSGLSSPGPEEIGEAELEDWLRGAGGWLPSGNVTDAVLLPWTEALREELDRRLEAAQPSESILAIPFGPEARAGLDTIAMGEWGPWDFEAGAPRPSMRRPGGALAGAAWKARWYSWMDGPDPRAGQETLEGWRKGAPLYSAELGEWRSPWGERDQARLAVGTERFGLLAETRIELEAGRYRITTLSDDGVRVRIDGRVVLENWTWHPATRDEAEVELEAGAHELELEYFQLDGAAALTIDLERVE